MDDVTTVNGFRGQAVSTSTATTSAAAAASLMEPLIPLSAPTDLLDSLIQPVSYPPALTRSPLPPIGFEVNGGSGCGNGLTGGGSGHSGGRGYSPFDDFFAMQTMRQNGSEVQMEKFESQIRAIAGEIQSTVQMHINGLIAREKHLLQQLETIRIRYQSILMQNAGRRPASFLRPSNGSSLLDRLDGESGSSLTGADDSGLTPLPNISFTKPDHALYKAITSMGFLIAPAFAPYCSASGEALDAVVPGQITSFVVLTKNCFNDELLIGRENVTASVIAFSEPIQNQSEAQSVAGIDLKRPFSMQQQQSQSNAAVGLKNPVHSRPQHAANGNAVMIRTPVSCSVVDHNNGKYTVSFTVPILRSELDHVQITVLVNGMAMSGCPFKVPVQLQQRQTWKKLTSLGSEGNQVGQLCRPWGVAIARMPGNFSPPSPQPPLISLSNGQSGSEHSANTSSSSPQSSSGSSNSGASIHSPIGMQHLHLHDISPSSSSNTGNGSVVPNTTSMSNSTNSSASASAHSNYLIAVADRSNNRIQVFAFDAATTHSYAVCIFGSGPGSRQGQFDRPAGLCFNTSIGHIVVADKDNHRIQVFDLSGRFMFKFGEKGNRSGQFCYPWDVESCPKTQQLLVSDTRNRRIQLFTPYGQYITHFSQPLDSPRGVAFLGDNKLVVSDFNKHRLLIFDRSADHHTHHLNNCSAPSTPTPPNSLTTRFIGFGEGSGWGEFLRPQGIAVSGSHVFCSDSRNNRICLYNLVTQSFEYLNEDLCLDRPSGIAVVDNIMVVVDFGNNRLQICHR
jgi:hypothetical protein